MRMCFSGDGEQFCDLVDGFWVAFCFFDYFPAVSGDEIYPCVLFLICSILPEGFEVVFLQVVDIFL